MTKNIKPMFKKQPAPTLSKEAQDAISKASTGPTPTAPDTSSTADAATGGEDGLATSESSGEVEGDDATSSTTEGTANESTDDASDSETTETGEGADGADTTDSSEGTEQQQVPSEGVDTSDMGVVLYYHRDSKTTSVFPPQHVAGAAGVEEMYDLGMIKEARTLHAIKCLIKDPDVEALAVQRFMQQVNSLRHLAKLPRKY